MSGNGSLRGVWGMTLEPWIKVTPDSKHHQHRVPRYIVVGLVLCTPHLGVVKEIGLTYAWPWLGKASGILKPISPNWWPPLLDNMSPLDQVHVWVVTQIEICVLTYSPLSLNECIHMSRQELNKWMNFFCTSDWEWYKFQLINLCWSLLWGGFIGREELIP